MGMRDRGGHAYGVCMGGEMGTSDQYPSHQGHSISVESIISIVNSALQVYTQLQVYMYIYLMKFVVSGHASCTN